LVLGVQVGKFVKKFEFFFFKGLILVMGHGLIFIMQGGNIGVLLMFGYGKKNGSIFQGPQVGVEMSV
jgi:hypothetical protein